MSNRLQPTVWAGLWTVLAEIRRSPIFALSLDRDSGVFRHQWASVRKSGNADAFVLAWLASERNAARRLNALN
jgi:hypothetical protein